VRTAAATLRMLPRAVTVLPRAVRLSPHWRRRLIVVCLLAVAVVAGYLFWLRDSSLVRVDKVTVSGLASPDAARVQAKLAVAARQMTTLHVNADVLRRAVADEPIVHSLTVHPDFPHALRVSIVKNRAVAMLVTGGREVAVAPDGTVLEGAKVAGGLPSIRVGALPAGIRMPDGLARDRVAVAAAAPVRLLSRVESISIQHGRGAVAQLRHGPAIYFGRAVELERKWAAAAGVLAQPSSGGATYIDVRMPDRPVAGGLGLKQDPQPGPDAQAAGVDAAPPGVTTAAPASPAPGATTTAPGAAAPPTAQASPAQTQTPAAPVQTAPPPAATASQPTPSNPQP
jgi:cell division protein FtsQ